MCFEPVAAVFVITMGKMICAFMTTFLEDSLFCLTPFFQRQFGLTSYIIFMKEFVFQTMVAMEIGK